MQNEIPTCDLQALCLTCNLPSGSDIPKPLQVQYWRARRLLSRLGNCGPMPVPVVVSVALAAGYGDERQCDKVIETFTDLVKRGAVKPNDFISVTWRDEVRKATFLAIRADGQVEFLLDTDKRTRSVPPDQARVLEKA